MLVKDIVDTVYQDYKKPSMLVACRMCDFKCGKDICQNSPLVNSPDIEISEERIVERFLNNPISEAIVFGGLEPIFQSSNILKIIRLLDERGEHPTIIVYTGYTEDEVEWVIRKLRTATQNLVVKFGRFVPNFTSHYDEVLGVNLASDNQYAVDYSKIKQPEETKSHNEQK